ncbi:hypothetical protein [Streptomyces sp. NPDC093990]|uniref:hypothetical protein n=1 Tax=Streptomyces sp. NPDC093990 TaxID=3155306 RepID=UPI003427EC19
MASGHISDRPVLAVTLTYHRRGWGYRALPNRELADLARSSTKRTRITETKGGRDDDYAW